MNSDIGLPVKSVSHIDKKSRVDIGAKRQVDFSWLVPTDGGAVCKTCVAFYTSRAIPLKHSGI